MLLRSKMSPTLIKFNKLRPQLNINLFLDKPHKVDKYYKIFSIRATLVQRPEFCLVIHRLRRSCGGFKAAGLETQYPGLCDRVGGGTALALCDQEGRHRDQDTSHNTLPPREGKQDGC